MNIKLGSILLAAGLALSSVPAVAGVVTFSDFSASWSNISGGTNVAYDPMGPTSAVYWGNSTGSGQSGYEFSSSAVDFDITLPPSPSDDFIVGTFTHFNRPISGGSSISGVQLSISAEILVDGISQGTKNFLYDFDHWETTNSNDPCADGGDHGEGVNVNGCADRVRLNYNSLSDSFLIGSDLYSLEIRGFLFGDLDTGTPATEFWTVENAENEAYLRARVTLTSDIGPGGQEVSEPATLGFLGLGLAAMWLRRRKM